MKTAKATVGASIFVYDLTASAIASLRRALRYPNPEYRKTRGRDDDIPSHLTAVEELPDGNIRIPRGSILELKTSLRINGIKAVFEDRRSPGNPISVKKVSGLRDYQSEGVEQVRRHLQGMIVLPCGGGKTTLGVGAMAEIGRSTLIIVPTTDLVDQWCATLRDWLGIEASVFGATKHEMGDVTVATSAALAYHGHQDLSRFGFVIFDECHRVAAPTHQALLHRIPARYRLGLTATPHREDGQTKVVQWTFGDVILEKTVPELHKDGWLVLPDIEVVHTRFFFKMPDEPEWKDYAKLNDALSCSSARNLAILNLIIKDRANNHCWLVLCGMIDHCDFLAEQLSEIGFAAKSVTSKLSKGRRKKAIQSLRDGSLQIMVATSLADEGLDIKRLDRVILASPGRAKGQLAQRIGRSMRPLGSKKPIIYDIVDHEVDMLHERWLARRRVYRRLRLKVSECPTLNLFAQATS